MHDGERVNVIMPVYEEGKTVYGVIRRVLAQKSVDRLIVVHDLRSKDNSLSEERRAARGSGRVSIITTGKSTGKGYSVRLGLDAVKKGIVIIQDADEEYYPEDYPRLLSAFSRTSPVFGYRSVDYGSSYALGRAVSRLHNCFFNLLFGQSVRDVNAGYKVFEKRMLGRARLKGNGFDLDIEIAARLAKNGYRIASVPIRYKGRTFQEGKKIGASSAINLFFYILKDRLA